MESVTFHARMTREYVQSLPVDWKGTCKEQSWVKAKKEWDK